MITEPPRKRRYKREGNPYDGPGISQEECAGRLGITRERVGQIERQALVKLRKLMTERGLSADLVRP